LLLGYMLWPRNASLPNIVVSKQVKYSPSVENILIGTYRELKKNKETFSKINE
jgi:hypothetical protein